MNVSGEMPFKVCLVVDNPLRDLDGLVLLGWHLAQKNVEVFLVSMSHIYESYFIKPDLVLLNYVRPANKRIIEIFQRLGVKVGILDTEGGILKDADFFFGSISRHADRVNLYCLWGLKQHEALGKTNFLPEDSLKITGCPRYDFCSPPWENALPDIPVSHEKMVLVNTNFPLIQPRFQSAEQEAEELVSAVGLEREYVSKLMASTRHACNEVVETIKHVALKFKEFTFIVRPHPFEDSAIYKNLFKSFSNVEVHQSGPVFPWIKRCLVLLHHNCSTAVEAVLMEKEPIHLGWLKFPLLEQPASVAVSQQPESLIELEDILTKVLRGQKLEVSEKKKAARKKIIRDWFYSNDGKNSDRVADAILDVINKDESNKELKEGLIKTLLIRPLLKRDLNSFAKHILIIALGSGVYKKIKGLRYKKGKEFNESDVRSILDRITKVVNAPKDITAGPGIERQKNIRYSVRLS